MMFEMAVNVDSAVIEGAEFICDVHLCVQCTGMTLALLPIINQYAINLYINDKFVYNLSS